LAPPLSKSKTLKACLLFSYIRKENAFLPALSEIYQTKNNM